MQSTANAGVSAVAPTKTVPVLALRIVDPVGDGAALGFGAKVVILHQFGDAVPLGAGILERANEFLLLGIDADHRGVLDGAALA